jgi:hypothetical protein
MSVERPTTHIRFVDGKLQQEWEIDYWERCNDWRCTTGRHKETRREWRFVESLTS